MMEERVNFRGENDGVHLMIEGENFESIMAILDKKLRMAKDFYKGAKLLCIKSDNFTNIEKLEIAYKLKYIYGFILDKDNLKDLVIEEEKEKEIVEIVKDVYTKCDTIFINRTIRSGQIIKHDGSVVIIGDVNPGAIIEAKFNIIVLGNFRGVGNAGYGDENSIVAAYRLNPTQLKISDKIARAPDKTENDKVPLPEVARIINDKLVIEPYLPNK